MVAPVVEHWLQVQGAQDVHFTGLRFYHAAWTLPPGGDPPVQAAARLGAAIELDDATGVTFDRVEIAHTGQRREILRARIVLKRASGCSLEEISARLGVRRRVAGKWCGRFERHGMAGLKDAKG